MHINSFLEYLFIGSLYLIPYFVVHYTVVCFKHDQKMSLIESFKLAYKRLPGFLKGSIPLEMKNPRIPVILFLLFLTVIGTNANGYLHHSDDFLFKVLRKVIPNTYETNIETAQYVKSIEAMFKYDKKECAELIGKIRFQITLTRHGIAHSIIHLICLLFILSCKKLSLATKLLWTVTILVTFFLAANGFLASNGWYSGIINTILKVDPENWIM